MRAGTRCVVRRICAVVGTESDYADLWRRGDRGNLLDAVAADHAGIEQRVQVIRSVSPASLLCAHNCERVHICTQIRNAMTNRHCQASCPWIV